MSCKTPQPPVHVDHVLLYVDKPSYVVVAQNIWPGILRAALLL